MQEYRAMAEAMSRRCLVRVYSGYSLQFTGYSYRVPGIFLNQRIGIK